LVQPDGMPQLNQQPGRRGRARHQRRLWAESALRQSEILRYGRGPIPHWPGCTSPATPGTLRGNRPRCN
jgi:hypothetical protein